MQSTSWGWGPGGLYAWRRLELGMPYLLSLAALPTPTSHWPVPIRRSAQVQVPGPLALEGQPSNMGQAGAENGPRQMQGTRAAQIP